MNKKIALVVFSCAFALVLVGCGTKIVEETSSSPEPEMKAAETATSTMPQDNRVKGSLADLTVGKHIMVIGTSNTDGSVNAKQIMLGEMQNFGTARFASSTSPRAPGSRQRPTGGMRNQSGASGEILSKDASTIIVKLRDGGSKIVFYSDKTEVFTLQPPK